jgi:kynurenine formamidase
MRRRHAIATAAAGLVGAVAGGATPAPAEPERADAQLRRASGNTAYAGGRMSLDRLRLVFLSHVNDPATTSGFPGDPEFTLTTAFTVPEDGFYLQYVKEGEHTGTHWGAPVHFDENGLAADQLDPGDLFLPAVKIDIRDKAARDQDYALTVADLKAWERRHGRIPEESAIILWTGWAKRWGTPAYANLDAEGRIHQPGFGIEAAQWLVDTGRLGRRGSLGTDTFGADVGIDETFAVSTLLFHRHRISLENLANLEALPTTGAWVLVGGPRNHHGSGSPATIFGVIPPG